MFHVRVKSPQDRVSISVLDRGTGHQRGDQRLGHVDLPLTDRLLTNREQALEVGCTDHLPGEEPRRRIVGVLQVAAMWESQAVC